MSNTENASKLKDNNMDSREVAKVFKNLASKGMFICSDEKDSKYMVIKNQEDMVVFRFKLVEGVTTLNSLKMRIDRMKSEVESCFK